MKVVRPRSSVHVDVWCLLSSDAWEREHNMKVVYKDRNTHTCIHNRSHTLKFPNSSVVTNRKHLCKKSERLQGY